VSSQFKGMKKLKLAFSQFCGLVPVKDGFWAKQFNKFGQHLWDIINRGWSWILLVTICWLVLLILLASLKNLFF
jgi:hypothetical protein